MERASTIVPAPATPADRPVCSVMPTAADVIPAAVTPTLRTLAEELLVEQGDLSVVGRFSRWHEAPTEPAQARFYRDLIPLTQPRVGEQYAFDVDLDKCSGCKACVSACHSLNGLDDGEAWRDTGLLVSNDWRQPYQQTVTTACHHCVDPACLNGCPVLAYDKDPVTGIVRHLDDQCIGCQYCVLKCPYDVPKYSVRRGIVRKCDMCSDRLAVGEAPACVQACPHEAIRITLVETKAVETGFRGDGKRNGNSVSAIPLTPSLSPSEGEKVPEGRVSGLLGTTFADGRGEDHASLDCLAAATFLPDSPAPAYTLPTTRYTTAKAIPASVRAADREELHSQPVHTPLVIMLVLSQLSVGLFAIELLLSLSALRPAQTLAALVAGLAGVAVSVGHLGRPLGAWRSFLNLRRSWLSREIVVFGLFLAMAGLHTTTVWFPHLTPGAVGRALGIATVVSGLLGVFCSAMVYHDTRREFWRLPLASGKFLGTTLLLGGAGSLLILLAPAPVVTLNLVLALVAVMLFAAGFKLALAQRVLRHLDDDDFSPLHKTALLLTGRLGLLARCGTASTIVGGMVMPALLALQSVASGAGTVPPGSLAAQAAIAFALCLASEVIERRLFFTAVQPVKMPGAIST